MTRTFKIAASREGAVDESKVRRAAAASFFGSMLEYYDFYIYASAAALIFGRLFFSASAGATGTLAALATFGVGYIARPIGGIVLGSLGDRIGRKKVMLFTVVLMGTSTFLIGCLPTYKSIGLLAPLLLVVLRLAQGFSAGGEQAGANSLTLEHAPARKRAFFTSWTLTGTQVGFILASIVFVAIAALPEDALLSWGWRIPFWCSAVVMVVAYMIRRTLEEPEVFEQARQANQDDRRVPALAVVRSHPLEILRVMLCAFVAVNGTTFTIFGLAYATGDEIGLSATTMLWVAIFANACALVIIPVTAMVADRIGRKPVFITGAIGGAITMFVYFFALSTGNIALILLGAFLVTSLFYSMFEATWPSFFAEMFSTEVRYSGTAIGTQFGFGLAGFAPTIGYAIIGDGKYGWLPVTVMVAVVLAIAAAAAATARETYLTPMAELGKPLSKRVIEDTDSSSRSTASIPVATPKG